MPNEETQTSNAATVSQASSSPVRLAVHPLFSAHAVLQRAENVPVWGRAMPHETVKVEIAGVAGDTVADDEGRWRVTLDLSQVDSQPHEMTIAAGDEVRVVYDVLVGEVWLGSGQSNMEWPLELTTDAE